MPPKKGTVKRPDVAERNRARISVVPPGGIPPARDYETEGLPSSTTPRKGTPEPPPIKRLVDDEEAEFVTEKDLKDRWKPTAIPDTKGKGKAPMEPGFIAEMVAGLGQKIHETEYGMTGHPVFIHGPADERIWMGVGRYAESQLDPSKYGVVVLLVALVASETMKFAVYAGDTMKQRKQREAIEGRKR